MKVIASDYNYANATNSEDYFLHFCKGNVPIPLDPKLKFKKKLSMLKLLNQT